MTDNTQAAGGWGFPVPAIYPHQIHQPKLAYKQGDLDGLCGIYSIIKGLLKIRDTESLLC